MSLLSTGSVQNDKVVFQQDFLSRRYVQDYGGVLVGCNVGLRGPGAIVNAVSNRIAYGSTQSLTANATQATFRAKFRSNCTTNGVIASKNNASGTNNAWRFYYIYGGGGTACICRLYIADAPGDGANNGISGFFSVNADVIVHYVYNGGLVAGSRLVMYVNGLPSSNGIAGTIPPRILSNGLPISIFNAYDGAANAPTAGAFTLFDFRIWSVPLTAAEVLDDALGKTFSVTP